MVGSLLRTQAAQGCPRESREGHDLRRRDSKAIEDREIRALVRKQEEIGLKAVTDGEFRRAFWHFDFLENLDGRRGLRTRRRHPVQGRDDEGRRACASSARSDFPADHPHSTHFKFLKTRHKRDAEDDHPRRRACCTIAAGGRDRHAGLYPSMDDYYADLGRAYAKAMQAFYDAGCRYLQLDDTSLAYFCDPEQRKMLRDRGDDPDSSLIGIYRDVHQRSQRATSPRTWSITTHPCRGNFRSTFIASGGYEPVADMVFNQIDVDGYFMEWDDDRSGGFEPLRFLPEGQGCRAGARHLEGRRAREGDDILRRIEEAPKFAPLEQLCLSPQCGFASTEEGNLARRGRAVGEARPDR